MKHLESTNILFELQYGFRANGSSESHIISLIQQFKYNNDKNIQTDLIIMDFVKAYHTSDYYTNTNSVAFQNRQ